MKTNLIKHTQSPDDIYSCNFQFIFKEHVNNFDLSFFSLSVIPDTNIFSWDDPNGSCSLRIIPSSIGRVSVFDKSILTYIISIIIQSVKLNEIDINSYLGCSIVFDAVDFFKVTMRDKNQKINKYNCNVIENSLIRLQGTIIKTTITSSHNIINDSISLIENWRTITNKTSNKIELIEIKLCDGIIQKIKNMDYFKIKHDYFHLRRPLARMLYEIACEYCYNKKTHSITLEQLYHKTGSKMRLGNFLKMIEVINSEKLLDFLIVISKTTPACLTKITFIRN